MTDPKSAGSKPPEPGSAEDLGLTKPIVPADKVPEKIEEKGEPFDGNFA